MAYKEKKIHTFFIKICYTSSLIFVDPIGKFRWIAGRGIFMEENQSAYYGQYYIPLQNLEQEILQWLRKLVDAYAEQAGRHL